VEFGGDPACKPAVLPTGGVSGNTISPYTIRQSTDSASYCLSLSALPVKLIYFKIASVGSNIQLQWRVADPQFAEEFILEKVVNGAWQSLYRLTADDFIDLYSYTDQHPSPGINTYRLKLIEKDGGFFYSPVRQLNSDLKTKEFVIYPNPASHQVVITGDFSSLTRVRLFDISGKLKWQKEIVSNNESVNIDVSWLEEGVYVLQIDKETKKLVINR
jgi:hypothetical protein